MPRETPTYYPGDRIALQVDIEHRVNFRRVSAAFHASVEGLGAAPEKHSKVITTDEVAVQKTRPDGTKTSVLYFEGRADSESLLAGEEYELAELIAETVGELRGGEGMQGVRVQFEVANVDKPRFRYEGEAGQHEVSVKRAALS